MIAKTQVKFNKNLISIQRSQIFSSFDALFEISLVFGFFLFDETKASKIYTSDRLISNFSGLPLTVSSATSAGSNCDAVMTFTFGLLRIPFLCILRTLNR